MRRVLNEMLVLGVLLALMLFLPQFAVEVPGSANPKTLAAIGFVLLAAFTAAELGSLFGLPKVTGFILAGISLGPHAGNVLETAVVDELRMFDELAIGLIATTAGLELDAKAIGRMWRTLTATVVLKILLAPTLVGGALIGYQLAFGEAMPNAELYALAALFAALSIGTSPSISLAVLSETQAKGRLSDMTLGLAVLKDVVVVVCVAVAVAVANSLLSPGAVLNSEIFFTVGMHIGEEVLLGVALAIVLVLYIRFVDAEMLLFVAAMILVVTKITQALVLDSLLVFIVAGFVVRNFSRYEHKLLHPLELVALPVFVVFFTNAGAKIDLPATISMLPLALTLCGARAIAFFVAGYWGAAAGGERLVVRKVAWLAYLPQAGVTLGLVFNVVAPQVKPLTEAVLNMGIAVVAINLLLGPITLRFALRAAGELPESDATAAAEADAQVPDDEPHGPRPRPRLASELLRGRFEQVVTGLDRLTTAFVREDVRPWTQEVLARYDGVLRSEQTISEAALSELVSATNQPLAVEERAQALRTLFDEYRAILQELEVEERFPFERHHFAPAAGEGLVRRMRRMVGRLGVWVFRRRRVVPLRMAARTRLEPELAAMVRQIFVEWCRVEAAVAFELRQVVAGGRQSQESRQRLATLLDDWVAQTELTFERRVSEGLHAFAEALERAGTMDLRVQEIQFSRVEPQVTHSINGLLGDARQWERALEAASRRLELVARLASLRNRCDVAVEQTFLQPLDAAMEVMVPEVQATHRRIGEIEAQLATDALDAESVAELAASSRKAFPQQVHVQLKKLRADFREKMPATAVTEAIRHAVDDMPERLSVLGARTELQFVESPEDIEIVDIAFRRLCEQALVIDLLPVVDARVRDAAALVTTINSDVREHVAVATFALETAAKSLTEDEDEDVRDLVVDGVSRSKRRLEEYLAELQQLRSELPLELREALADALAVIDAQLAHGSKERKTGPSRWERISRQTKRLLSSVAELSTATSRRLVRMIRRVRSSDLVRERSSDTFVDAAMLGEILASERRLASQSELPPIYERLFAAEPLHDRRLFAVRKRELKILLREEQAAYEGGSAGVLIVGERGSGRTSLLNVARVECRASRVLWVGQARPGEFLNALAVELQTDAQPGPVRVALAEENTAILVDDLERWFLPNPEGIVQLQAILDLVVTTRHVAFWAVALAEEAFKLVEPLAGVREAFGRMLQLGPLGPDALAHVIETRNRVSGLAIVYPRAPWRLLGGRTAEAERSAYYGWLARESAGNLAAGLRTWHRNVELDSEDTVVAVKRTAPTKGPTIGNLHPTTLAVLVEALRFGALDLDSLRKVLMLTAGELNRHVGFLRAAGVVERRTGLGRGLRIVPELQPALVRELGRIGALRRL